jgi:hypothetical protein
MIVSLTMLRYPRRFVPFALLAMMIFRIPLGFNRHCSFWKLLGSGKNGTFDKKPDWRQWGILSAWGQKPLAFRSIDEPLQNELFLKEVYGSFLSGWVKFFDCEAWTVLLEPLEGHGTWDGKKAFGDLLSRSDHQGRLAILTRATIRLSRMKAFWGQVDGVAVKMAGSKGFVCSLGIGELPFVKQATFSVWESREDMLQFAYGMKEHTEVIRRTRSERWYSEEMFTRFRILASCGTLKGVDPLKGKS